MIGRHDFNIIVQKFLLLYMKIVFDFRDICLGKICPHGNNCTYAHGVIELRNGKNLFAASSNSDKIINRTNITNCALYNAPTTCYPEVQDEIFFSLSNKPISVPKIINHLNTTQLTQTQVISSMQLQNVSTPIESLVNITTLQTVHSQPTQPLSTSGLASAHGPIVGAIDSTTGNFVNLIPVQTVAQNSLPTREQSGFLIVIFLILNA